MIHVDGPTLYLILIGVGIGFTFGYLVGCDRRPPERDP